MQSLRTLLNSMINLSDSEWQLFIDCLQTQNVAAKSQLVEAGAIAKHIYFIEEGLFRTYRIENGKEISTYFSCDGQAISCFSSFITQSPSTEYLQALEDSKTYSLSYQNLQKLYKVSQQFEALSRLFAEQNYLCILNRSHTMQTKTAKEKYEEFLNKYAPKIIQRVPQHQLASYLGVAPESLSRIRKELSIS